jgi:hypothetical protein
MDIASVIHTCYKGTVCGHTQPAFKQQSLDSSARLHFCMSNQVQGCCRLDRIRETKHMLHTSQLWPTAASHLSRDSELVQNHVQTG